MVLKMVWLLLKHVWTSKHYKVKALLFLQTKMRKKDQHAYCNWHVNGNNTKWQNKELLKSYLGSN